MKLLTKQNRPNSLVFRLFGLFCISTVSSPLSPLLETEVNGLNPSLDTRLRLPPTCRFFNQVFRRFATDSSFFTVVATLLSAIQQASDGSSSMDLMLCSDRIVPSVAGDVVRNDWGDVEPVVDGYRRLVFHLKQNIELKLMRSSSASLDTPSGQWSVSLFNR